MDMYNKFLVGAAERGESAWTPEAVLDALRRRSLIALVTFVAVALLGFLAVAMLPTRYTATALVVIDSSEARLLGGVESAPDMVNAPNIIATETEIAQSPSILGSVVEKLGLAEDEEFLYRPSSVNRALGLIGLDPVPVPVGQADETALAMARTAVVENLDRAVEVRRRGTTNVIGISVQSRDALKAARIANAVAETYIAAQADQKASAARSAAQVLRGRVDDLERQIRTIEAELDAFVANAAETYGSQADRIAIQQLTANLQEESRLGAERSATLASLNAYLLAGDPARIAAEALSGRERLAGLVAERDGLLAARPDASDARQAQIDREVQRIDRQLRQAVGETVEALTTEVDATNSRIGSMRSELEQRIGAITLPNDAAVRYYALQREAKASRDLYETTLERLRGLEQQVEFAAPDSRLVSPAMVPNRISFPPLKILLGLSIVIAAAAGCGAAIVRDRYMGGFTSARQISQVTGLEVVASVPVHRTRVAQFSDTLLAEPLSPFAEAFRRLKLGVEGLLDHRRNIVLMVTSTTAREGKSTVSLALAEIFAQSGWKTLIIDADLRKPSIAQTLGFSTELGLYDLLEGNGNVREVMFEDGRYKRGQLHILPGREAIGVPTDQLVGSDRFAGILRSARSVFDVVIIDTPPIGHVVDARIIARNVDLSLYVVRWGEVNQSSVLEGLGELGRGGSARTGVVLNQAADKSAFAAVGYYLEKPR